MLYKLKIHSAVDLITNSSTTIYTFHDKCIGPLKELVNEMLSVMNHTETFDDIMRADIFLDSYNYVNRFEDYNVGDYTYENCINNVRGELSPSKYVEKLIECTLKGEIVKPDWMKAIEDHYQDSEVYNDTFLLIKAKDPIYQPLCNKLMNFLNSIDIAESYD